MWDRIKSAVASHPYVVAGGVLVVIVLMYLYTRSSSQASAPASGVYAQTADPNVVAANAQQAIAQNETNAAVDTNASNNATALSLAGIQSGVLNGQTAASVSIAGLQAGTINAQTAAQQAVALAGIGAVQESTDLQTTTAGGVATLGLNDTSALDQAALAGALSSGAQLGITGSLGTINLNPPSMWAPPPAAAIAPAAAPPPTPAPITIIRRIVRRAAPAAAAPAASPPAAPATPPTFYEGYVAPANDTFGSEGSGTWVYSTTPSAETPAPIDPTAQSAVYAGLLSGGIPLAGGDAYFLNQMYGST